MKINEKKKTKSLRKSVLAPFFVLKIEKFYLFWILSFFISFAGVIIDFLNKDGANIVKNGMIYSTCMAILSPLFIDFLTEYTSLNRQKAREEYSSYKAWSIGICLTMLVLLFLFYVTKMRSVLIVQIICLIIVFLISFYTYLVTKMQTHQELLKDFKDKSYLDVEKDILKSTAKKSKKIKSTVNADGVEIKL